MLWDIVVKLRNREKLSISEELEFETFFESRLKFDKDKNAVDKDRLQGAMKDFLENLVEKGYYDNKMQEWFSCPDRNDQLSYYIIRSMKNEAGELAKQENEFEKENITLTKNSDDGDEDRNEYEVEDLKANTEEDVHCTLLKEKFSVMLNGILDFIEKKDGRGGEIKRIYKRDRHYLEQKNADDKAWVRKTLANERLTEEGNLAVNFVIFFIWWWDEEETCDGKSYILQDYVDYVKDKTDGALKKNDSTEDDRAKNLLNCISVLFKESGATSKDMDFAGFFLRGLTAEFEERKPEILKKIRKTSAEDALYE